MSATIPQVGHFTLTPTLPSFNSRYDRIISNSQPHSFVIPSQTFVVKTISDFKQSPNVRAGFAAFVHPEGDLYFSDESRSIITSSDPELAPWGRILEAAYQKIVHLLGGTNRLPSSSEIWLGPLQTPVEVGYYLLDHDKRVIYWLEDADVRVLGLGAFESTVDLRGALNSEYWAHVDYFPGHRGVDARAENDLIATLQHGCIDDMTAPGSTFPWSAEECRHFLHVLEGFQRASSDENVAQRMSCIARLWAAICRVRHIHGYGTSNARLDRFQGLEGYLSHQLASSVSLAIGDAATFGQSRHLFRRMTELWNARIVYQRHWRLFLDDMRREWMQMTYFALAIWMACIILVASGKAGTVVFVSAWLAAAAFLASLRLQQTHAEDKLSTAPGISSWISQVEDTKHGLRPLSITFALPRALTMYAFVALQLGLVLLYRAQ